MLSWPCHCRLWAVTTYGQNSYYFIKLLLWKNNYNPNASNMHRLSQKWKIWLLENLSSFSCDCISLVTHQCFFWNIYFFSSSCPTNEQVRLSPHALGTMPQPLTHTKKGKVLNHLRRAVAKSWLKCVAAVHQS